MHSNTSLLFMVNVAAGMDCGCSRSTKNDDVVQHGGYTPANRSSRSYRLVSSVHIFQLTTAGLYLVPAENTMAHACN